jgi:hypothetical protein
MQRRLVEKRVHRRQAHIAATGAGTALVLEIVEKRADDRGIQIGQR